MEELKNKNTIWREQNRENIERYFLDERYSSKDCMALNYYALIACILNQTLTVESALREMGIYLYKGRK